MHMVTGESEFTDPYYRTAAGDEENHTSSGCSESHSPDGCMKKRLQVIGPAAVLKGLSHPPSTRAGTHIHHLHATSANATYSSTGGAEQMFLHLSELLPLPGRALHGCATIPLSLHSPVKAARRNSAGASWVKETWEHMSLPQV